MSTKRDGVAEIVSKKGCYTKKHTSVAQQKYTGPMRLYYLGDQHPDVYLTLREAQCLYQLIKGQTFVATGEKMSISHRTVEYYVKNVRSKMRCHTKLELISVILSTDFMKVIGPEVTLGPLE